MKFKIDSQRFEEGLNITGPSYPYINQIHPGKNISKTKSNAVHEEKGGVAGILMITSYPPRECGIATYSQDLIKSIKNKFSSSLSIKVCALESGTESYSYPREVKYTLNTSAEEDFDSLANKINIDSQIDIVLVQHEFGFYKLQEQKFEQLLQQLTKPVVIVFHTVLPNPDQQLKTKVRNIAAACRSIIVMTNNSAELLSGSYDIPKQKITVISHGTHLVQHLSKKFLKAKYGFKGRSILTTFGLLSSGKSLETTLDALPAIIKNSPEILFLILGKTHPEVVKSEGEKYRNSLIAKIALNKLTDHVKFVNSYLALPDLLEYLQLTDIYLFTTNDPNQAVSGTFAYAMSCACPIISTPIPHAKEVLTDDTGIIFDFRNSEQLAHGVIRLLNDETLRKNISSNVLHKIVPTSWENSAVAHASLFEKIAGENFKIQYDHPVINLDHLTRMTTESGMIQFSKINQPDIRSGYTLDDNARALVACCMNFKLTGDEEMVFEIQNYLRFIKRCLQSDGSFLNYIDSSNVFSNQNFTENLDDANGRAVWALGYLISLKSLLPAGIISEAEKIIKKSLKRIGNVHSTRAMAFAIKGLYYYQGTVPSAENVSLIKTFADRLREMYRHESNEKWEWFEAYLTYANSILPEAMLMAWLVTGKTDYKDIAIPSLRFLLQQTFKEKWIEVISNKNWLQKGQEAKHSGEQPIDVAYTVMTLGHFYDATGDPAYLAKMKIAFSWFLGNNRLNQIIYNPCTGGCYDGLEDTHVNLNQGAESTVSYLMARLSVEKYQKHDPA